MLRSLLTTLLVGMLPLSIERESVAAIARVDVPPPTPLLFSGSGSPLADVGNRLSASGVIIVDLESGQRMYTKAATAPRPMASLTKLMTAILIAENHELDAWVPVPNDIERVDGNVAWLPAGEEFLVKDLLSALLVASANDAAIALARFHSGSVGAFVEAMNRRAEELGLRDTSFANPTGMDASTQWSTPQDLAWLAMFAWQLPPINERMRMRGVRIISRSGTTIPLTHTHALLHADTLVIAGKTGTTNGAGQSLLSVVEVGEHTYLIVLLRSINRYEDMRRILQVFKGMS